MDNCIFNFLVESNFEVQFRPQHIIGGMNAFLFSHTEARNIGKC